MSEGRSQKTPRRLQLACDPCRTAKLKCDRNLPVCEQVSSLSEIEGDSHLTLVLIQAVVSASSDRGSPSASIRRRG